MSETDPTAHLDTFARDGLPPRDLWPAMDHSGLPELARYPARLNCVSPLLDRWVAEGKGRSHRAGLPRRAVELSRAVGAGEPHRARAGRRSRGGAGEPGAAPWAELADDGRLLVRPCSRRAASASRPCRCCAAVRSPRFRRRRRSAWLSPIIGSRRTRTPRSQSSPLECVVRWGDGRQRLARPLDGRQAGHLPQRTDRSRRRGADRLHLRNYRRAEGDHALSSRHSRLL